MSLTTLMLLLALLGQVASSRSPAAGLERGTTAERLEVLADILDVPPSQREPDAWRTMRREATRMLSVFRTAKETDAENQRDLESAYAAGLARGLGESGQPAVIPVLVQLTGFSRYAMDAVARFGDLSVPELLRVARGNNNDLGQENGAASVMALLLHEPALQSRIKALSDESRLQMARFAEQLLERNRQLRSDQIVDLANVAIESGRLDLRREVERLAEDATAWESHGVTAPSSIQLGQNILHYRLTHPLD